MSPKLSIALLLALFTQLTISRSEADEKPDEIRVATWNIEWFFDYDQSDNLSRLGKELSAPNKEEWKWRVEQVAGAIAEMNPTILALQEIENRRVLYGLRSVLRETFDKDFDIAFIEGLDFFTGQDVGLIYQSGLVEYSRKQQSTEMHESNSHRNINKHLFAKFEWGQGEDKQQLTLATVHFKATPESVETRNKQAELLHTWLREDIVAGKNVICLGDFNTETDCVSPDTKAEMHVICGLKSLSDKDDLIDLHRQLPVKHRWTHMIGKQFDRILVSQSMIDDASGQEDFVFHSIVNRKDLVVRGEKDRDHRDGYYKIEKSERDLSDHYPIMATFRFK